jgi:hypothetical protein
MRKKIVTALVLVGILFAIAAGLHLKKVEAQSATTFHFKYETGYLFLQSPNLIQAIVINVGSSTHSARVIVWQVFDSSTARSNVADSGSVAIGAGKLNGATFNAPSSSVANYQVEIFTDSPEMVPGIRINNQTCSWPCAEPTIQILPGQLAKFEGEF